MFVTLPTQTVEIVLVSVAVMFIRIGLIDLTVVALRVWLRIIGGSTSTVIVVVMELFKFPVVSFAANLIMHGPFVAVHPIADGVVFTW